MVDSRGARRCRKKRRSEVGVGGPVSWAPISYAPAMANERLIPVFMPSLCALLLNRERAKGAPLSEAEVIAIRDDAIAVMMPEAEASALAESRGYPDINPERCWTEWVALRPTLP
jgi:hypothetical protein